MCMEAKSKRSYQIARNHKRRAPASSKWTLIEPISSYYYLNQHIVAFNLETSEWVAPLSHFQIMRHQAQHRPLLFDTNRFHNQSIHISQVPLLFPKNPFKVKQITLS